MGEKIPFDMPHARRWQERGAALLCALPVLCTSVAMLLQSALATGLGTDKGDMLSEQAMRVLSVENDLEALTRDSIIPFFEASPRRYFRGKDGVSIAYAIFRDGDVPPERQDAIVMVGGRAETFRKYAELIYQLHELGYAVYAYDHRGQGYSERLLPGKENHGPSPVRHRLRRSLHNGPRVT